MLKILPGRGYSNKTMIKQADEISRCLEKYRFTPDIVVGHFANPSTALVSILAAHYKAKSSIVFHGDCNEKTILRYKLKDYVTNIGAVGVRSKVEAQRVKELLNLDYIPFVCYSGVPNEALNSVDRTCAKHNYSNGIRYLYVGSFIKRKHLDSVIKAFDKVATDNDSLTIVGGGPEEYLVKKLIAHCKHKSQIVLVGRVSRNKVLEYMKVSHIFTLISEGEVFGMVYIEAMLQGCITIASFGGGFDGIINDGINGFLCAPGNELSLQEVYLKIKNLNSEERNNIGQVAIDTAIHFTEREVADNYYNDIVTFNNKA